MEPVWVSRSFQLRRAFDEAILGSRVSANRQTRGLIGKLHEVGKLVRNPDLLNSVGEVREAA